jgi:hypothetical protein
MNWEKNYFHSDGFKKSIFQINDSNGLDRVTEDFTMARGHSPPFLSDHTNLARILRFARIIINLLGRNQTWR